ncbi:MAG TPA: HD domain-containing phosphohydrolase [Tepidiformaceae bacterium]|nr:HD domain-containing phosphohydrolase [Tepidiformaceae bacterium]
MNRIRPWSVLKPRRVKWKIMLPFVVLTGLVAAVATHNVTQFLASSLEARLDGQLVGAAQQTADAVAKREREHLELVRVLANTEGVAGALAERDRTAAALLGLPAAANASAEFAALFDYSGSAVFEVLYAADPQFRDDPGVDVAPHEWSIVWSVLGNRIDARGDKWAQVVDGPLGPMLLSVGPVRDDRGALVGVAAVGTSIETLLRGIKRDSFAEVSFFDPNGHLIASTFDAADADPRNGGFRGTGMEAGAGHGSNGHVLGRQFRFLNTELRIRGEVAGSASVALSFDSVAAAGHQMRIRMAVIFAVITVGVIAVGWFVARHLTGPLSRLVNAADSMSRGDLSARSNVRTSDEIGMLGASFDVMAERLEFQHLATIGALASAIDARDPYTAGHSIRVGDLSAELGGALGLPRPSLHHLRVGGLLHDIGKIGIPDNVLLKPGGLTPEERRLIEQHPTIGLRILESAQLPREVLQIVGGHHERMDGSGYPLGLGSEELSVFPRIAMVADVYDALTTDRPYRKGLSPQETIRALWREAEAGLMDPEVVAAMRRIVALWEERRRTDSVVTQAWIASLAAVRTGASNAA